MGKAVLAAYILALYLRLDGASPGNHRSLPVNAHPHLTGYLREGDGTRLDRLDPALHKLAPYFRK
jgi:hypothetical protein